AAFLEYGLPLEIYVDYHTLFFTHIPDALTQLGWALHFYGISFRYAPTPQAKGKIERGHHFWQERLPAYFASERVSEIEQANSHSVPTHHGPLLSSQRTTKSKRQAHGPALDPSKMTCLLLKYPYLKFVSF